MTHVISKKETVLRLVVLALSASIGLLFVLLGPTNAYAAVTAKHLSIVEDDKIRLEDVFDNLDNKDFRRDAGRVIGNAPKPGDDLIINARTLSRISSAFGLSWRPDSVMDQVVIRREATVITHQEISDHIKNALADKGLTDSFSLLFYNGPQDIVLPGKKDPALTTQALNFDANKDVFEAVVTTSTGEKLTLSGKVERMIRIPVLKDTLRKEDIISAYDIEWIEMRARDIHKDLIIDADDLTGMTPRSMLMAGKPVRTTDVMPPKIVNRGEQVTILFEHGALSLTSKGKALQHGAKGDIVRVLNLSSNKMIEGFVVAERTVQVQ